MSKQGVAAFILKPGDDPHGLGGLSLQIPAV